MKITNIDVEQSLLHRRLIFKSSPSYKFDLIFQIFINVILWLALGINLLNYSSYDRNLKSFLYAFVVFILILNYSLYVKLREKRLSVMRTNNTEAINRDRILTLAEQENWTIKRDSENIIIAFEDCGDIGIGNNKQQTRVFLLSRDEVYFTIFTEKRRLNTPDLFARSDIKSDLKKALATTGGLKKETAI